MRPMVRSVAAVMMLAVCSSSSQAGVLYATGFEPPTFTAGQTVNGQGGWGSFFSPDAGVITTNNPRSGLQALQVNGSQIDNSVGGGLLGGIYRRRLDYDTVANGTPIIDISVDVRLDGPRTGTTIDDDLISANLSAIDGDGNYLLELILSSNGNIYSFDSDNNFAYALETPAGLGEYYKLGMRLDFLTRTAGLFVNGQSIGTLPFYSGTTSDVFRGAYLEMLAIDDPGFDASEYTAYFDNLEVRASTIPEPASLVVFGMTMGGVLVVRRRKRSNARCA